MFDLGWSELLLIAAVTLVVVGPREIPRVLRTIRGMLAKLRNISQEFHSTMEDAAREADLADLKRDLLNEGQELRDVRDEAFEKIIEEDQKTIADKYATTKSTLKDASFVGKPAKTADAEQEKKDLKEKEGQEIPETKPYDTHEAKS